MDFKTKIIEAAINAEAEINKTIISYKETIKHQQELIAKLQKTTEKDIIIDNQKNEIQKLQKKLKINEGEKLLLQVRLDLALSKEKKVEKKEKEEIIETIIPAANSKKMVKKDTEDDEWEKTLLEVRNDLAAVNEKRKIEKNYYNTPPSSDSLSELDAFSAIGGFSKPSIYKYKINVIDKMVLETFQKKYNLAEREAILPLYETKNSREIYLYTEAETIFIDLLLKEIYMVQEEFERLQSRYSPLVLKHRLLTNVKHANQQKQGVNSNVPQLGTLQTKFASTKKPVEDLAFSEQSELNKLGYRISSVSREDRWEVLRKAIPILGLKKVVNIISANIRLRKRQKNGEDKYRHAITEWEYDLNQLKEKYFFDEFKWPKV